MSVKDCVNAYDADTKLMLGFIGFVHAKHPVSGSMFPPDLQKFLTESAYLRAYVAWESFLEGTFTCYLMGEPSLGGNVPTRYINPVTYDHAKSILIGTQRYVDWSNPDVVRKLAKLAFDSGEPFETMLAAIHSDLSDMRTIRNAAAHVSATTQQALNALAARKLKTSVVSVSVYDLITSIDTSCPANTLLDSYIAILGTAVHNIANW